MTLADADMPAMFKAADTASNDAQSAYLRCFKWHSLALVVAATAGATTLIWDEHDVDIAGLVAVLAFLVALGISIVVSHRKYEGRWYEARAVAESAKTLAWSYSVGAASIPLSLSDQEARQRMTSRLAGLLCGLKHDAAIRPEGTLNITPGMDRLRQASFAERRDAYLAGRIDDQLSWYVGRAKRNDDLAGRWFVATITLELAGVALGFAKAARFIEFDALGILAAIAAVIGAWARVKQYESLASAYSLTARELSIVRDRAPQDEDEDAWAEYVHDAEEAISREHTMWKASHVVP